jgi:hypothetical protein
MDFSFDPAHTGQTRGDQACETRDLPKRAATDGTPDATTSARRSTFHQYQHDQTTCPQCLSKERCPFALLQYSWRSQHKTSSDPMHSQMPSSPRGEHAAAAMECDFEAYNPMKRWEDEKFREQPWHGIARDLMSEECSGDYISGCQQVAEARIQTPFVGEDGIETEQSFLAEWDREHESF